MKFGKLAKIGQNWKWVSLSDAEVDNALDELRKHNIREARTCMEESLTSEILNALLDKQLVTVYTFLNLAVDEKINKMRDEINNRGKSFGTYEKKPYVQKEEPPKGKSLLNKVYENLEEADNKGDEQLDDA
jgi:hypothetical protein